MDFKENINMKRVIRRGITVEQLIADTFCKSISLTCCLVLDEDISKNV